MSKCKTEPGTPRRHRFHAICPYFAMFPESFAERWLENVSRRGQVVLDPFCGRGTTPFQAILMGRSAIACDINPVAFCITKAKTNAPSRSPVLGRITGLETRYVADAWEAARRRLPTFFRHAYSPETLRQLLYLKSSLNWRGKPTDCMVAAIALGALHGESNKSPSYFSNQMPRTISTKPRYSVKFWKERKYRAPRRNVFELLRKGTKFRYASDPPNCRARVINADMRELPWLLRDVAGSIRCAITSPPYLDVTSFEEDQWLRLWFLGGAPNPTYRKVSRDDRHETPSAYWSLIADMWRALGCLLARNADVVIRLGARNTEPERLADALEGASLFSGRRVRLVECETSKIVRKQTKSFRPGSTGCVVEIDCHFRMR